MATATDRHADPLADRFALNFDGPAPFDGHPRLWRLLLGAACVPSLVSSWGLYKGTRWGLLSFVWLLVITGIGNIGVAWWMDRVAAVLIGMLGEADVVEALNAQRILFTATVLGSCVLFAVLQGWLAWRLMRPDIRSRY
mgnify:CR=1 FL=1